MLATSQDGAGQSQSRGEAQLQDAVHGVWAEGAQVHGGGDGQVQLQVLLVLYCQVQRVHGGGGQVLLSEVIAREILNKHGNKEERLFLIISTEGVQYGKKLVTSLGFYFEKFVQRLI